MSHPRKKETEPEAESRKRRFDFFSQHYLHEALSRLKHLSCSSLLYQVEISHSFLQTWLYEDPEGVVFHWLRLRIARADSLFYDPT